MLRVGEEISRIECAIQGTDCCGSKGMEIMQVIERGACFSWKDTVGSGASRANGAKVAGEARSETV